VVCSVVQHWFFFLCMSRRRDTQYVIVPVQCLSCINYFSYFQSAAVYFLRQPVTLLKFHGS
jgi:hypothetical protein